ncbi:cellulose-binding protein [Viridothelium virens]|uniref:Cellulose-binding protein n=1 Tax=Viridothelium virens TaxID=1048519 RepID=A0A6A6H7E8_VIRVR|nr:cellulose-binding protein [Viridothelium virens]
MMYPLTYIFPIVVLAALVFAAPGPQPKCSGVSSPESRTRVFVMSDISNEPDDTMSFVRLLLHSNMYNIEGMVAVTSYWLNSSTYPDQIRNVTTAYGKVVNNLQTHANEQYPSEKYLLSCIRSGPTSYGLAAIDALQQGSSISPGAQLLLDVLDSSEKPLYVQVWGGANTLAEGLWQANKTRSPTDLAALVSKLRVYTISDQDDTGAWIRLHFPQLRFVNSIHGWNQYGLAAWCGISGEKYYAFDHGGPDSSLVSNAWIARNIQVGPFGSHYPDIAFIMEGDSPSQLFNYDNGLNVPEHPEYGGWGGRYLPVDVSTVNGQHYSDATDQVVGQNGELFISNHATIWRWREAYQHEMAARMQWTLRKNGPGSNTTHPPVVVVNGSCGSQPIEINVKPSEKVVLDASETYDPDHPASASSLSFEWWHYRDVTATQWNVDAEVPKLNATAVPGSNGRVVSIEMPAEDLACVQLTAPTSSGSRYCQQYHMIVQVRNSGSPSMTRYRRVILKIVG